MCVFLTWYLTVLSIEKSLFSLCNNKCFVGRYYETIKKSSFSHLCPFLTPIDNSCLEQLLLHLSNGNSLFPSFLLHLIRILLQERAFPSRSFICLFNYLFISVWMNGFCFTPWANISYYHYLFHAEIGSDFANSFLCHLSCPHHFLIISFFFTS